MCFDWYDFIHRSVHIAANVILASKVPIANGTSMNVIVIVLAVIMVPALIKRMTMNAIVI